MFFLKRFLTLSIVITLAMVSTKLLATEVADEFDDSLEDFYGDEDFVSIATGSKQLIHKAPSTATVITEEEIQRIGAVDLDEVLETVPGLHVSYRPGNHLPIYSFRGIYSVFNPQVLVLINEVPITNLFIGNRNQIWGGLTLESVSRIEIIRGPGSAVYGADAFAGVINIITKSSATANGTSIGARVGEFSTKDFWLTHAWNRGELGGFVSYERHETDGFDQFIESDAQIFLDGVFGTDASLAPGYADHHRKNDELRLRLDYNSWTFNAGLQKRRIGVGLGIAEALGPGTNESSDRWNFDVGYTSNEMFENWEISAKVAYLSTSQEIDNNLIVFPAGADIGLGGPFPDGVIGNPEVFEKHIRTNVVARYKAMSDHSLSLGIGYDVSDLYKVKESKNFALGPNGEFLVPGSPLVDVTDTPFVFLPEDDRTNQYFFIQDIWNLAKDWELTAGVRQDDYSDFGKTINPRLAIVWSTTLNLTTKFLYGKAFRAPSFAEMRNINNPVALGNPNLDPEEIDSFELAFDYHPQSDFKYGISIFRYDWQDIINFAQDEDSTTKTAKNIGEQQGYGFEVEVDWSPYENFNLIGNYSWLNAEDGNNTSVDSVPEQQMYLRAYYKINNSWDLSLKTNWVMDRVRAIDDLREPIDDYNVTDFSISWKPESEKLNVSVLIKNMFDSDIREPTANNGPVVNLSNDLPLPRRTALVQVSYYFG